MQLPLYQIDAFTNHVFGGNPACVVPLIEWLPDATLLQIASENAVAETAFFVPTPNGYHLRWFTPEMEMDLCGHATLAAAHCIVTQLHNSAQTLHFETLSGTLTVTRNQSLYVLNFPTRMPEPTTLPNTIARALSIQPKEVLKARDYMLVYDSEADIRNVVVNRALFDEVQLGTGGVIVTARGTESDFVSRFFVPNAAAIEDPVTGSAHCSLIPYWAEQLNKTELIAYQLSSRVGKLFCTHFKDRVLIAGEAKTYSVGTLYLDK